MDKFKSERHLDMKEKGIISTNQYVWMLYSVITAFTVLEVPGILIYYAGRDAWISVVGAWFLDVLLAIVYAYMGLRFPGQNLVQYSMTILGKFAGRIVGSMFPLFFLMVTSLVMRFLVTLITKLFLPKTPMEVLLAIGYILIAYGVRKGIETIARVCEVLGPIFLLSMITLFVLLIPKVQLHRLKPMLTQGVYPFLTGIPFILSFIGICIIMGMYIPICSRPKNGFLGKLIAVSIGAAMTIILVIFSISVFGAEQAGNMINPGFQLVRLANIGSFLERLEIILLIVAFTAGIMTSANFIWAFSLGISQIAGLSTYKPLVYPAVLIAFVLNLTTFDTAIEVFNFATYSFLFIAIFVEVGLEMLLFIAALILKKRGNKIL